MDGDYPKAESMLGKVQSSISHKIDRVFYWPGSLWCNRRGHPKNLMKFARLAKPDNSESISFRVCRLCNCVYEQDVLTSLAILEREINAMEAADGRKE